VIALIAYVAILSPLVATRGIESFLQVGSTFTHLSDRSSPIAKVPVQSRIGYDGQFAYFIALDPVNARYFIDRPAYRYGRIGYPAVAWAAALGQPGALPYTFLLINILAVVGTIWLLAGYLRRRAVSPWWAAVYGFFPGLLLCVLADLTEPSAFFLVACALVLLERRPGWAAVAFAGAALTRETTLVFALLAAAALWRRWRMATLVAVVSVLPVLVYRGLIGWWLGGAPAEGKFSLIPFAGFARWPFDSAHRLVLYAVVLPGLVWLLLACRSLVRRPSLPVALVAANAALFVVWLPGNVYLNYGSASRASTGLVLAAVFALPYLKRARPAMVLLTIGWTLAVAGLAAA
jgi:hypothetical protein